MEARDSNDDIRIPLKTLRDPRTGRKYLEVDVQNGIIIVKSGSGGDKNNYSTSIETLVRMWRPNAIIIDLPPEAIKAIAGAAN